MINIVVNIEIKMYETASQKVVHSLIVHNKRGVSNIDVTLHINALRAFDHERRRNA